MDKILSSSLKRVVIQKLLSFAENLAPILWAAVKDAHQAFDITPDAFLKGILRNDGTAWDSSNLFYIDGQRPHPDRVKLDPDRDPYSQLNLTVWLEYLLYGGRRVVGRENGWPLYATDQDAYFDYFNIPQNYAEENPRHAHFRLCEMGLYLDTLLVTGSDFTYAAPEEIEKMPDKVLVGYYDALMAVLEPLCRCPWSEQAECRRLRNKLAEDFDRLIREPKLEALLEAGADSEALYELGRRYELGDGVCRDPLEAVTCYQAAAMDLPEAKLALANCYRNGVGVSVDMFKAVYLYRELCAMEYAPAMCALAECCLYGLNVRENPEEAFRLFFKAAEMGDAEGLWNLGECCRYGIGTEPDPEKAYAWYEKAAQQGLVKAMFELGGCCADGIGVEEDIRDALEWYSQAANRGHKQAWALACVISAKAPFHQKQENLKGAIARLWIMANDNDPMAQYELGQCYEQGIGVLQSNLDACSMYYQSALRDCKKAMRAMGRCLEKGIGIPANSQESANWYQRAVEHGDPVAMCLLADRAVEEGDREKAYGLYCRAAAFGSGYARSVLDEWKA